MTNSTFFKLIEDPRYQRLQAALAGTPLYLVGGCVRDACMGLDPHDLDLTCELIPTELSQKLVAAGMHVVPTGLRHQTVTVIVEPGAAPVEITTFRSAGMDPAGGVSVGASIEEDLAYRDFTINAIAVGPDGTVFDPNGGLADLAAKRLKTVGDADQRFTEDPLRVWRMVRFACVLGFEVSPSTLAAAKRHSAEAAKCSVERIREEFNRIIGAPATAAVRGIRMLVEIDALAPVLPEINAMVGFEQNRFHHLNLFDHTLAVVEKTSDILELRLAALLHDIGKVPTLSINPDTGDRHFYLHETVGAEMTAELLKRLKYPKQTIAQVETLVRTHMRPVTAGLPGLRRLLRDIEEVFDWWRELKEADAKSCTMDLEALRLQLERFDELIAEIKKGPNISPLKNLAISGKDLIELGKTPGPRFGEILRGLHERVLDCPELNQRDTLLALVPEIESELERAALEPCPSEPVPSAGDQQS